jgi:uncharacterized protein (TIGR02271 family)
VSTSPEENELTLREEELVLGKTVREIGSIQARKRIESEEVSDLVPRAIERARIDREPVGERDSGEIETLPDGSISIPLLEEELVISRRIVVRERIVIRKETEIEESHVRAEVRRERLDIESTQKRPSNEES